MRRQYLSILFILFLSSITSCLHFGHAPLKHTTAQSELQALKAQQSKLEIQVNSLISNINDVDTKVKKAANTNDKVQILQSAIIMERQTVFNLSNSIVPPFNLSKNACQELTNDQKINLLDQVSKNKQQIAKLKKIASTIPPCDQIKMINSDLQKQSVIIEGIEKILYTKCDSSVILSPTIFQSNIYASNWILGNQTIDDLIEQYYQRSIQYDNITNCPLDFPYFDGSSCINCSADLPVFNMFSKKCDVCPEDTRINVDLRVCEQIPHYTDYAKASNYNLDGADSLPNPTPNLTPCPAKTPFWNGKCINCKNAKWWSVKDNICKSCPAGKAFDINQKSCVTPSGVPYLTVLVGTQWVTSSGNASTVLKQRADLIASKKSDIEYCSSQSPYFDGFQCIACDKYFDLKTLKCVDAPSNMVYDDNIHAFIAPETNKQTNTKASNLVSAGVLTNSSVPDCDLSTPYYDGKACISCPQPFILFDLATKKCVACDVTEIYNSTSRKCQKRETVLISTNFNNLLATPTKSIADYKQELYDKANKQGDYIVTSCENPSYYSNYTHCFPCKSTQYFGVDVKKCVTCNGTINQTTMVCIPNKTYLTDLAKSSNLVIPEGKKLTDYENQQKSIVGPTEKCPADKPYAVSGSQCVACSAPNIQFNLETQQCSSCGLNEFYNKQTRQCEKGVFVSNLTALKNFVQVDNYTISNIRKQNQETAKTKFIIECNATTPFFDGKKCSSCPDNTYVNLKNFTCVTPTLTANVTALFELDNVFEETNYTIDDIDASISKIKGPVATCPANTPAFNGKICYSCPETKYYKLKTNQCVEGKYVSNITTLKQLSNVKQAENYTIANIEKQITQITLPTLPCNQTKPLFDGKKCINCDSYSEYDLKNLNCIPPQFYTNTTALKTLKVIETQNYTLANVETQNSKIANPKKPCPPSTPLFNSKQCISCPNGTFYNIKTLDCLTAAFVSNTSAIKKSNNFVQTDNYTLSNIQKQISANPLPTQLCSESTPFFDGKKCISCTNSLYNLKQGCFNCTIEQTYNKTTNKCQEKPHFYPNLTNTNWIVKDNDGVNRVISFTKQRQALANSLPCPQKSEFFNNKTQNCQSCPVGNFFNYDTFECGLCAKGQQLDTNTHKCNTRKIGKFQTSLERDNLTYNGVPLNQLKDYYNSNKTAYPTIQDCPQQTPFFDGFECITCQQYSPYFNMDTQKCQNCVNSKYDPALHECVQPKSPVSTSPNIAKMYSSIF